MGTTATQPRSGRPRKMMERGQRMLRRKVRRGRQLSAESITSSRIVRGELHGMSFHGRASASKQYISRYNAKRWMQWCKAHCHWTLEQWRCVLWSDESRFSICQSEGRVWNAEKVRNSHKHSYTLWKASQRSWSRYSCKGRTDVILNPVD